MKFLTASRSQTELASAKDELNNIFIDAIQGEKKTFNAKGMEVLRANRFEIGELITTIVQDEVAFTDPTPFLVDTTTGDIRNNYQFKRLDGTLRVVKRSYGSKPMSQRLTWKTQSFHTSSKEIAVELPLEEIASGSFTPSIMAEQMAQAVNRYRVAAIIDGLDAAIPAVADRTGKAGYQLRYAGLTKANLDLAIDGILDESGSPTIFGRHTALYPAIRDFAGWSQNTLSEFEKRGVIGSYLGAQIVTLEDKFSRVLGGHFLRNDRAYITSGTKGAVFMQKDVSFLNWSEVNEKYASFGTGIRLEDGLIVTDPYQYRVITIA